MRGDWVEKRCNCETEREDSGGDWNEENKYKKTDNEKTNNYTNAGTRTIKPQMKLVVYYKYLY